MIKIYVCMAILCIKLHENEADDTPVASTVTIPKLDFWTPDPKFNDRRYYGNRRMQDDEKEDKIYYRRGRVNPYARYTRRVQTKSTSLKYRERLAQGRHEKHIDHRPRKPLALVSPQTIQQSKGWPRAKRPPQRGGTNEDHSTRLTPMYLMQQPNEESPADIVTTPRSTTEATAQQKLSPYALEAQMHGMLSQHKDVNVSIEVIGRTIEYNNILLVKLSKIESDIGKYFRTEDSKYIEDVPEKKIVFIVHGLSVMGVRELAALNDNLYFSTLLNYYLKHLDKFDIFLIPMANPDGYVAAATKSFWNKNMSPQSSCEGVALDRNFDVAWNSEKVYSPCSQLYPGPTAFSEGETKAVRDVLHHYGHKIIAYIHVHAGTPSTDVFKGDAVLYPKGFTEVQSDDDKYIDLRGDIDETMRNASFRVMSVTVDTLHNWYGKVHGSSVDYAATVYGIPYALEFVMQLYENNEFNDGPVGNIDYDALTVIWQRIIDVVFHNIHKNMHANDVK